MLRWCVIGAVFSLAVVVMGQESKPGAWSKEFTPPLALDTPRVHLEPLKPEHAELDHQAVMSSREHLRKTLHWGDWPAEGMSVAENRSDLERHWKEFENREAYAYTVMTPDRKRCVGCVYLKPGGNRPRDAMLAFWVAEEELAGDLDKHLLEALVLWLERVWPLDTVTIPLHTDNGRGVKIAEDLKLRRLGAPKDDMVRFAWMRK